MKPEQLEYLLCYRLEQAHETLNIARSGDFVGAVCFRSHRAQVVIFSHSDD
jgi:hypothetical protein